MVTITKRKEYAFKEEKIRLETGRVKNCERNKPDLVFWVHEIKFEHEVQDYDGIEYYRSCIS